MQPPPNERWPNLNCHCSSCDDEWAVAAITDFRNVPRIFSSFSLPKPELSQSRHFADLQLLFPAF
jgi:hypothetical protein